MKTSSTPAAEPSAPSVLTQPELARLLGINPSTLRRLSAQGKGPKAINLGGSKRLVRYLVSDLTSYLHGEQANADRDPGGRSAAANKAAAARQAGIIEGIIDNEPGEKEL